MQHINSSTRLSFILLKHCIAIQAALLCTERLRGFPVTVLYRKTPCVAMGKTRPYANQNGQIYHIQQ